MEEDVRGGGENRATELFTELHHLQTYTSTKVAWGKGSLRHLDILLMEILFW